MKRHKTAMAPRKRKHSVDLLQRIRVWKELPPGPTDDTLPLDEWEQLYRRIRDVARNLNNRLLEILPPDAVLSAAKNLRMFVDGQVIVHDDSQMTILCDHAIYNHRVDGKNAVQRLWEQERPAAGSDAERFLQGALRARYALILVQEALPDFGLRVRDIFTGEALLLADINMSHSVRPGMTFAGRLMFQPEFCMSTGAGVPIFSAEVLLKIGDFVARTGLAGMDFRRLPVERAQWFESFVLNAILDTDGTDRVRFEDPN